MDAESQPCDDLTVILDLIVKLQTDPVQCLLLERKSSFYNLFIPSSEGLLIRDFLIKPFSAYSCLAVSKLHPCAAWDHPLRNDGTYQFILQACFVVDSTHEGVLALNRSPPNGLYSSVIPIIIPPNPTVLTLSSNTSAVEHSSWQWWVTKAPSERRVRKSSTWYPCLWIKKAEMTLSRQRETFWLWNYSLLIPNVFIVTETVVDTCHGRLDPIEVQNGIWRGDSGYVSCSRRSGWGSIES